MRILVHVSGGKPDPWLAELRTVLPEAELRVWQPGDDDPADYAVVWKPPAAMLGRRPGLKAVFNVGAGVDAILELGDAVPAELPVIRLDDAGMGMQMAEYVTHAVLRYFRRFDEFAMQENAANWRFLKPYEKRDFRVGILGLGVLGRRIAEALAHFDFPLNGWSRSQRNLAGIQCYAGPEGFTEFLRHSRVLVCVLPLTPETRGLLNRAALAHLPQGAFLINVARGDHVVEQDLLELVQNGHIAGATLDVFNEEPLPRAHPFWKEPRITVTPHCAALTLRGDSIRQIAGKIRALERGEPVAGLVDRTKGY